MDKNFFRKTLRIGLPVLLEQFLISSFGIIDTIMVKYINRGISGVGLASQISSVSGIVSFAFAIGVGMFIAQYFGDKDNEKLKSTFSVLLFLMFCVGLVFTLIGSLIPHQVLSLFSSDEEVLEVGATYLRIVALSYIPNLLSYAFSIAYRNIQKTTVPLFIHVAGVAVNVLINWLLIFGVWIFPKIGIRGAAYGTLISCIVTVVVDFIYASCSKQIFMPKLSNIKECFNKNYLKPIFKKSLPLLLNESFFSIGTLLYVVIFNRLGSDAYEGYRISESIVSIVYSISLGLSSAVSSMVGEALGSENFSQAKKYGDGFVKLGVILMIAIGIGVFFLAGPLVMLFKSDTVNNNTIRIAIDLMKVSALRIALRLYANILFSIFRAGGRSKFVVLIDSIIMWMVGIPIAYVGYRFLHIDNIAILFLIMQMEYVVRIIIALKEYFKYTWEQNIIHMNLEGEVND